MIEIREETADCIDDYARVPMVYTVRSRLRIAVSESGLGGVTLTEEPVVPPWEKDYDRDYGDAENPLGWRRWSTIDEWGFWSAFDGPDRIGGAALAWRTPELCMLKGRDDVAALWDMRVAPGYRRQGTGSALFEAVTSGARERGCTLLLIETQNINVPACRFYAAQGCTLGAIDRYAYADLPDETQLIWTLPL